MSLPPAAPSLEERARLSGGHSHAAIYATVAACLAGARGRLVDVGCGGGALRGWLGPGIGEYVGVDGARFAGFPAAGTLVLADLNAGIPMRDAVADAVVSVETIEHLENPRAFMRELARIAGPGAPIVVTTPNQLSALSLLTLVTRRRFASFQDVHYPAHLTALLEVDLRRIAGEAGLDDVRIRYTLAGRVLFTPRHYPRAVASVSPRLFSDTVVLTGRKRAAS